MWTNSEKSVVQGLLNHGLKVLEHSILEPDVMKQYFYKLEQEKLDYPKSKVDFNYENWFIPQKYQNFDIESWLLSKCCNNLSTLSRVEQELELYRVHNMIPVLKTMKYIVDTFRDNDIVWGVGRGSSVASYILYLIGVHKVDSIKYDLPISDFFKGEDNGKISTKYERA